MIAFLFLIGCVWCSVSSGVLGGSQITISEATNEVLTVCPGDFISIACSHNTPDLGITRWEVSQTNSSADCNEAVAHGAPVDTSCGLGNITMISGSTPPFNSTFQARATEELNGALVQCFYSGHPDTLVGNVSIIVTSSTPNITSFEQVSQSVVRVSLSVTDSQCVDSYQVEATPVEGSGSISTSSLTSTVNVSGLDVCQYNYSFVGSVFTAGDVQSELSSPQSFSVNLSVINGITVTINQMDPLIEWVQMDNPLYPTCITGYEITDQNSAQSGTFSSTTRSLTAQQLSAVGFPYCTTIRLTVIPVTLMGPIQTLSSPDELFFIDLGFPTPQLSRTVTRNSNNLTLHISMQNVTSITVPDRSYQYNTTGVTFSTMSFTGDSFEIDLSGEETGETITITVMFQNSACESMASISVTVPSLMITDVIQGQPTDTNHTITITLPYTEYQPEQLLIISTVEPLSDGGLIMADFTSPSMQYTVTFDDLDPDTEYTFTIRIVLRLDNTVDVIPAVTGSFLTQSNSTEPPPTSTTTGDTMIPTAETTSGTTLDGSGGCDLVCITSSAVGGVVALLLLVLFIIVIAIIAMKAGSRGVYHVDRAATMNLSSLTQQSRQTSQEPPRSEITDV